MIKSGEDRMTKHTPDPAAGASRWEAPPAGSLRPATDLVAGGRTAAHRRFGQLDSAALRDALLDLHDFWLTTKATEIGITAPVASPSSPPVAGSR